VILFDINVLVYAHREDAPDHNVDLEWLREAMGSEAAYGVSDLVLSGFLRVVTHPRVFRVPSPMKIALAFTHALRERPNCVLISPGSRHWEIFTNLCRTAGVKGNLVTDAYLAALARAHGGRLLTLDRGLAAAHPDVAELVEVAGR